MDDLDEVLMDNDNNYNVPIGRNLEGINGTGKKSMNSSMSNMGTYAKNRHI
mgnify:FL=1